MKTAIFLIFAVIALGIGMQMLKRMAAGKEKSKGAFEPKQIATINEQGMFWRLVSAFPANEYIVLTQVSFGALLTAKGGASRYSFSQKIADFVLINKGFKVLAIIELDDSSHKGREAKDESRDAMLIEAGYKVLRYTRPPEIEQLRRDITIQPSQPEPIHKANGADARQRLNKSTLPEHGKLSGESHPMKPTHRV